MKYKPKLGFGVGVGNHYVPRSTNHSQTLETGVLPKHISNGTAKAFELYNHPLKGIPERTCLYVDSKI
jgi:hypothetical protein